MTVTVIMPLRRKKSDVYITRCGRFAIVEIQQAEQQVLGVGRSQRHWMITRIEGPMRGLLADSGLPWEAQFATRREAVRALAAALAAHDARQGERDS